MPNMEPPISESASGVPLDTVTRLARRLFDVPLAFIVHAGEPPPGLPPASPWRWPEALRAAYLACQENELVVVTAAELARDPATPCLAFYAGCPVSGTQGERLGTLCLAGPQRSGLDDDERRDLRDLARTAAAFIERDRARLALIEQRSNEERMAMAIAGSETGIWDRNVVTGEIHYSSGWKGLLGYDEDDVTPYIEDSYARLHPDDADYVIRNMQEHFEGKTDSYCVEHRIRCKDGSYKWICSRGKVVSRDAAGQALRMMGTTTDITAMRALSEKLQQSGALITNLTNEVPGLVFQQRLAPGGEAQLLYASAGITDIYGLAQRAPIDLGEIEQIIYPDDLPRYRASLTTSAANLAPWHIEYRVMLPGQGIAWRQGDARPQRMPDGGTLWHGVVIDITERKRIEAELQGFATIDFLTQTANRRYFLVQAQAELAHMQGNDGPAAALLMFDLDHFKSINDRWGHAVGDRALVHFSAILRGALRKSDIVGRVGGEEFAVVLVAADMNQAQSFARQVQQRLADAPLMEDDCSIALTTSIGIAAMIATDASVDIALSLSDIALYRAKAGGRNRIECFIRDA